MVRDREAERDVAKRARAATPIAEVGKATLAEPAADGIVHAAQRHQFHTIRAGELFADDGAAIASVPAHRPIDVVAGKRATIAGRGECAFASYQGRTGWIATGCLPPVAARELARTPVRGGGGLTIDTPPRAVKRRKRSVDALSDHMLLAWPDEATGDVDGIALDEIDEFFVDDAVEQREHAGDRYAYGYVLGEGGEQIYGWIDASQLAGA